MLEWTDILTKGSLILHGAQIGAEKYAKNHGESYLKIRYLNKI